MVSPRASDVPKDVAVEVEQGPGGTIATLPSDALMNGWGSSPDGVLSAASADATRPGPAMAITDKTTGTRKVFLVRVSGYMSAAGWLNDRTLLVGLSRCGDNAGRLMLLDAMTGRTTTVLRVAPLRVHSPVTIDRIVADPEGFAVFSVYNPFLTYQWSWLYRYDVASRSVECMGVVPQDADWDYSPSRNAIVALDPESGGLMEWPLPWP
jgi:hypothetical protein